jgi:DNA helicase-4
VVELLDHDYPLETTEFDTPLTQELSHLTGCRQCKSGILVGREGRFGRFYGCSNYPLCEHVERGCQVCAQPMQRAGRFNLCLAPNCTGWVPLCPDCGGEMTQREGSHGQFWGCRNYRRDDPASCKHTEDTIVYRAQPADLSERPVIATEDLVT